MVQDLSQNGFNARTKLDPEIVISLDAFMKRLETLRWEGAIDWAAVGPLLSVAQGIAQACYDEGFKEAIRRLDKALDDRSRNSSARCRARYTTREGAL